MFSTLLMLGPLCSLSQSVECTGQQCPDTSGLGLLQKRSNIAKINLDGSDMESKQQARGAALDAQFLIQATFGPTRESIKEISDSSYEDWIRKQISLPTGSHREYF